MPLTRKEEKPLTSYKVPPGIQVLPSTSHPPRTAQSLQFVTSGSSFAAFAVAMWLCGYEQDMIEGVL